MSTGSFLRNWATFLPKESGRTRYLHSLEAGGKRLCCSNYLEEGVCLLSLREDFQSGVVLLLAVVALALGRFIEIMQSS